MENMINATELNTVKGMKRAYALGTKIPGANVALVYEVVSDTVVGAWAFPHCAANDCTMQVSDLEHIARECLSLQCRSSERLAFTVVD